jgi:hypothetical protein
MDIPSLSGVSSRVAYVGNEPVPVATTQAADQIDAFAKQPRPSRFPWLSRLTQILESATKKPGAFGAVPVMGDNVDESA